MNCTVYIDESGDLGINRGTRWFTLSGIIVNDESEASIRQAINDVRLKFNISTLHFRNLKDSRQRSYVINKLSPYNFEIVSIVVDSSKLTLKNVKDGQKVSFVTYNYATKLLLERVSWLLRDTCRNGKIILSARGEGRDEELIDYIEQKLLPYPSNNIANVFSTVSKKSASQWDLLQLADVSATALFYAYEINGYGFREPCYMHKLWPHYYRYKGKLTNYGLKYYSQEMKPDESYFSQNLICK